MAEGVLCLLFEASSRREERASGFNTGTTEAVVQQVAHRSVVGPPTGVVSKRSEMFLLKA